MAIQLAFTVHPGGVHLFVLAAFNVPSPPRINLTAAGLALLTAGFFFT